jgi:hypothetical protein
MINDMKELLFLFSVIALAACGGSDDAETTPPDVPSPRLLTVVVNENPMQDENAPSREMTRAGGAITTASLTAFKMVSSKNTTDEILSFSKDGEGKWTTGVWPTNAGDSEKLDFYAYNAGTPNWGNAPYISFTVEENVANQKDILVAKHEKISRTDNGGQVSLTFDHACAAVRFYVYKEEDATYKINSIKLNNVKKSGDYYYNNAEWVLGGATTYYTLTTNVPENPFEVTTTKEQLPCGWLYLIPQTKDDIKIEINYNSGKQKTLTLSSGTWEAGKQYTVNIRIGKAAS